MLTPYIPILRAPSDNSPTWYKDFHNIFYLSQLTGVLLLSYLETFFEKISKNIILEVKRDYLLKHKIISCDYDEENEIIYINKEDELKSLDIEDFLNSIIKEHFEKHFEKMRIYLTAIGIKPNDDLNKNINIDLKELLKTTNAKNWYKVIKGFLNIWEFLFLYSISETTFKKILDITGPTREESLIQNIIDKFKHKQLESILVKKIPISLGAINHLWILYTEFRNIYSHSHGIITQRARSNIGGKLENFRNSFDPIALGEFWIDITKIFENNLLKKDKIYLLQDIELNIFRNFIIAFMESLEEIHVKDITNHST